MIDFNFMTDCYMCRNCENVCPTGAIQIDDELYPSVDSSKCVDCGQCDKFCPKQHEKEYNSKFSETNSYFARSKNRTNQLDSSSGGIFYHLAIYAIENGWYVCGCIYDELLMTKHVLTMDEKIISKMKGSKYIQSDTNTTFIQIRNLLLSGEKVLFSGTPCQVAALQLFVRHHENLFAIAIACHGTIERKYWKYYLDEEEAKNGKIVSVSMRNKNHGWLNYGLRFVFDDDSEHITFRSEDGYFLQSFTEGYFERERCLKCNYKGSNIFADIILADAWGVKDINIDMYDEGGVSSVICLTDKGKELWGKILEDTIFCPVETEKIIDRNQRIIYPAERNYKRESFQRKIDKKPKKIQEYCETAVKLPFLKRIIIRMKLAVIDKIRN